MEISCDDGTYTGSALERHINTFHKALGKAKLMLPTGDMLKEFAEDAGFVGVEVHLFKQPWGSWPKDPNMKKLGQIMEMAAVSGFEVYPTQRLAPLPSL